MTYRLTEADLADLKKRQGENLSNFQRNSGRGLPVETVTAMEKASGVRMDDNGVPIPEKLSAVTRRSKKSTKKAKLPVPTEHEECRWLMDWAKTQRFNGWPVSDFLIHVPNGSARGRDRKQAAVIGGKLRAQGMQAGVSDYIVPIPLWSKQCPGLWLEMKRTHGGSVSHDQITFHERMLSLGWRCEIAKGWVQASEIISAYLRSCTVR